MKYLLILLLGVTILSSSCTHERDNESLKNDILIKPELIESGLKSLVVDVNIGDKLYIKPVFNTSSLSYLWTMSSEVMSSDKAYTFSASKTGNYTIKLSVENSMGKVDIDYKIRVFNIRKSTSSSSPYISCLHEYKPAPGQFINTLAYGSIKAAKSILGKPSSSLVSLGGFGGYIILGFDHTVIDNIGPDIFVYSNCFKGSSEPGIVMVSFDYNANGKADDEWYELCSSEYHSPSTIANYTITYYNQPDVRDVRWTDNLGGEGFIKHNMWNKQAYYPNFISQDKTLSFTGRLLADKSYRDKQTGQLINPSRKWGYVDNFSDEYIFHRANSFDISWAVDTKGDKFILPGVDFIKIYTATNHSDDLLGENSTEIKGVADISMLEL